MERCEPLAVNWPKFEALAGKNRKPSETLLKGTFRCSLIGLLYIKSCSPFSYKPSFSFLSSF